MGVLSMDGSSSSSSYPCQKCGCVCTPKPRETQSKYSRECEDFFDQIVDNSYQSADPVSSHGHHFQHHHQQQQQQPYSTPTTTTNFQDYHHRHHRATTSANLDLHHQVESLKARLKQTSEHVEKLEHSLFEVRKGAEQDAKKFQNELKSSRDKYERLLESHKQMQRVNQMLEEKVISTAEKAESDGAKLQSVVLSLSSQLNASAYHVQSLEAANERLRRDCSVAVRLLQCRSSTFLTHRFDDLPANLQERVKANLSYEEIKRVEEARQSGGGTSGGAGGGLGALWSLFSLPSSMTVVSTFPPSAAFFNENKYSPLDIDEMRNQDSVAIDMNDADVEDISAVGLPTSVLARVFDSAIGGVTSSSYAPQTASSSADKINSSVLTPEQENLLKLYDKKPPSSSPIILKPDIFPSSSSSSSCSDTNEVNLQYYKCRRCRLQCVTAEKWTQTPLAPIYGGNGQPSTSTTIEEDSQQIASLPIHLVGWKSGNSNANLLPLSSSSSSLSATRSTFSHLPDSSLNFFSSSSAFPAPSRGRIPHASTFPDLGVFPDLVPSAELTTAKARLASTSSSSSSRTVQSQTDETVGLTMSMKTESGSSAGTSSGTVVTSTLATPGLTSFDSFDAVGRRRNDSETGSVFGGGWGDIHFGDLIINGVNVSHADVVLDISGDLSNSGVAGGLGGVAQSNAGASVDVSSGSMLSTCLEEVALND